MIHLIGIGPGDPELLTIKAARLLGEADVIYVPQSNGDGRSVAEVIIAPHADPAKIRYAAISMRFAERGVDPAYARLAGEIADQAAKGLRVVYVSLGDTLLYSTAQYLARELEKLGACYGYVPGIPAFVAAASHSGAHLASGREGLAVHVMPDSVEELEELAAGCTTVVLMKVNKRVPVLMEYVQLFQPERAVLLHRIGLEGEAAYELAGNSAMSAMSAIPGDIGYLSIAIIRRKG